MEVNGVSLGSQPLEWQVKRATKLWRIRSGGSYSLWAEDLAVWWAQSIPYTRIPVRMYNSKDIFASQSSDLLSCDICSCVQTYLEYWHTVDGCVCRDLRAEPRLDTCKPPHSEPYHCVPTVVPIMSNLSATCKLLLP